MESWRITGITVTAASLYMKHTVAYLQHIVGCHCSLVTA